MNFKVGDRVKVARDCGGNSYNDCAYCPPIGLIGTIVRLGQEKKSGVDVDVAFIDTRHDGKSSIECHQLELAGE